MTGLERSTIQRIIKAKSSRRSRKGTTTRPHTISKTNLKRVLRFVSASWDNRRMSYSRVKVKCKVNGLVTSLRRALKAAGYRRCVACRRPFISKKQAQKRMEFARKYQWWGTADWKKVIWSDEATFETGKIGKIFVTCRPEEKNCQNYIQSIYRSGRVSVMV